MSDLQFPSYINKDALLPPTNIDSGLKWFCQCDSEDTFGSNLKLLPADWHYRNKQVVYCFNSNKYRAPEFDSINWSQSVVIFGCSIVFGVGVSEDETIGYYLSQIMNRPVINLGQSATSMMYSLYNSVALSKNFPTPWAVVQCWTSSNRIVEATRTELKHVHSKIYNYWNASSNNTEFHSYYIELLGEHIWKDRTRYVSGSFFDSRYGPTFFETIDRARDLIHPGPKSNYEAAKKIAKELMPTSSNG